ncbi:MAG: hypothetical protein ISR44_00815 [Rhodospirillales bacterium]|nr:hypothetical protein [Rhodospirillales bacterium]
MDNSLRTRVLKQLARTGGEIAEKACHKEAAKIATMLENETRFDLLKQQIELLDIFAFRVPNTAVEIVQCFLERIRRLELTHPNEHNWPDVDLTKYYNKGHLVIRALELLDRIRYHRFEDILGIFMSHSVNEDAEVRSQAIQGLKHLSEYNLDIYYSGENRAGIGPGPQLKILDCMEALGAAEKRKNFSAIIEICIQMLSPSMTSTTADYKSFTWSTGSIPATDEIKDIRRRSLQLLVGLYGMATSTAEKMSVLDAMRVATTTPHQVEYGDDVLDMVYKGALEVLAFFKKIIPEENLQIVQKVEHDSFWQFRRSSNNDLKAAALDVRDLLANNDEYTIYKDLIGFDGVFGDWEASLTKEPDFGEIREYRSAKSKEYADSINVENWAEWRDRIFSFSTTESDDLATFPNFFEFLRHFAEKSPDLAFGLLTDNLDEIHLFTIPLLRGLWIGPRRTDLRVLLIEWIEADKQLGAIAKLFMSNDEIDEELLQILLGKAQKDVNRDILILLIGVAASNYADGRKDLIQELFLPAVESLTKINDASWVNEIWYRSERKDILSSLGEDGREIILGGLLVVDDIDYHAEALLAPMAKDNPERIITFFGERLRYKEDIKPEGRYDAIPFKFYKLQDTLADFPEIAVNTVRSWFEGNWALFRFHGANLLKIIFPDFAEPFGTKLLELVQTGKRKDIEFVLSVLLNYQGQPFLHGICKAIVAALQEGDKLLGTVSMVLRTTGVVSGEFGFAEAYERKIEEIRPWLNDGNEKVRNYSADYITGRENEAKLERRQAEEEIELRKHAYGVREEETDGEDVASEQQEIAKKNGGQEN